MTGQQAIKYFEQPSEHCAIPSASRMSLLLEKLGNPEASLKFVLLCGSNGTGSVSSMLSSVFHRCEYKASLFSPHTLRRVQESIQVDDKLIDLNSFGQLTETVLAQATEVVALGHTQPTTLELSFAIALLHFKQQRCDIVILEGNHGGNDDIFHPSHGIFLPIVTVITKITKQQEWSNPHQTHEDAICTIADVITKGTTVVLYDQSPDVMDIISRTATEREVPLVISNPKQVQLVSQTPKGQKVVISGKPIQISLVGEHQRHNVALTLDTVKQLEGNGYSLPTSAVLAGLTRTMCPGRFEIGHFSPDFIVDRCQNLQSLEASIKTFQELYPSKSMICLVGMLEGEDYSAVLTKILPFAKLFVTVTPNHPSSLDGAVLSQYLGKNAALPVIPCDTVDDGVHVVLEQAQSEDVICAFGSLPLVDDVRRALGLL